MRGAIYKSLFTGVLCLFMSCSAFAGSSDDVMQIIIKQAKDMGVEQAIVLSIAQTESGFNQAAKSKSGHIGVFQLSDSTAKNMNLDPYKLEDNIKGGITYYKNMFEKFGSMELAVAAYNVGPDALIRNNKVIPKYSQPFVDRIMAGYNSYKKSGL